MLRVHHFILCLFLVLTFSCGGTDQGNVPSEETVAGDDVQAPASTEETVSTQKEEPRPATSVVKATPKRETPPAPSTTAPPQPRYETLRAGTVIPVRLQDSLDSGINQSGDTFRAVVDQDIMTGNRVVVPKGSLVEGTLTYVERSGRVKGRAAMSLQIISLNVDKRSYPVQTEILSFEAEGTKKEDAAKVGIASGIGAAIGAIAGGGKGAAIGAAVGAGAGGAGVAATRGKEVKFSVEDALEFTLNEDVPIRIE